MSGIKIKRANIPAETVTRESPSVSSVAQSAGLKAIVARATKQQFICRRNVCANLIAEVA